MYECNSCFFYYGLFSVFIGTIVAFCFNWQLQKRLLKSQNKDKVIDLLMELLDKQINFYVDYWSRDEDDEPLLKRTDLQIRFLGALYIANEKYNISKAVSIKYREFYDAALSNDAGSTSGNYFGKLNRKTDKDRCKKIYIAANDLRIELLKCKV